MSGTIATRPAVGEQRGDLADPAHVLGAVLRAEPEVGVEAEAQLVAVQPVRRPARLDEEPLQRLGHRRLARTRQTR